MELCFPSMAVWTCASSCEGCSFLFPRGESSRQHNLHWALHRQCARNRNRRLQRFFPSWAYDTFEDSQPDELTEEGLLSVRNPFPNWNHLFLFCQLAIYWKLCHLLFRSTYSMVHGNRVSRFTINEVHPVTMAAKWAGGAFMQSPRHITVKDVCSENRMRCFPWAQMATF